MCGGGGGGLGALEGWMGCREVGERVGGCAWTTPVFHHLSLEHNGKSNIIIGTLDNKRTNVCVTAHTLFPPMLYGAPPRRCCGLLKIGHKSKTWRFFPFFFFLFIVEVGCCLAEE